MKRLRTTSILFVALGFFTIAEPERLRPSLDGARHVLAELVLSPVAWFGQKDADAGSNEGGSRIADAERAWQSWLDATGRSSGRPLDRAVVERLPASRALIVAGGIADGIDCGMMVGTPTALVGIVDRVEVHHCRVRLLSHRSSYFAGAVLRRDRVAGIDEITARVLLKGMDGDLAVTERGSVIPESAVGDDVVTVGQGGVPEGLLIGRVVGSSRFGLPAVELDGAWSHADDLRVFGRDGRALQAVADDPWRTVPGRLLAVGGAASGDDSFFVDIGARDGLAEGAWVRAGGVLVGRLTRVGAGASRGVFLESDGRALACVAVVPPAAEAPLRFRLVDDANEVRLDPGECLFARGRSLEPRGALLRARGNAFHEDIGLARPTPGTEVQVLCSRFSAEVAALKRGLGP